MFFLKVSSKVSQKSSKSRTRMSSSKLPKSHQKDMNNIRSWWNPTSSKLSLLLLSLYKLTKFPSSPHPLLQPNNKAQNTLQNNNSMRSFRCWQASMALWLASSPSSITSKPMWRGGSIIPMPDWSCSRKMSRWSRKICERDEKDPIRVIVHIYSFLPILAYPPPSLLTLLLKDIPASTLPINISLVTSNHFSRNVGQSAWSTHSTLHSSLHIVVLGFQPVPIRSLCDSIRRSCVISCSVRVRGSYSGLPTRVRGRDDARLDSFEVGGIVWWVGDG